MRMHWGWTVKRVGHRSRYDFPRNEILAVGLSDPKSNRSGFVITGQFGSPPRNYWWLHWSLFALTPLGVIALFQQYLYPFWYYAVEPWWNITLTGWLK